jgi:hypothetical protein
METQAVASTSCQIPSELLYKILVGVLADSVHTICMSESADHLHWHYNVFSTLCNVCFLFQEIARDIAVKTLAIKGEKERCAFVLFVVYILCFSSESHPSIPRLVREKLQYLRTLGVRFRSPFGHSPESFSPTDGSHLIQAYSLYLTATALRHNAIETQDCGEVFQTAHTLVLKALGMSLRICDLVQPKGIEDILRRTVGNEIVLVEISAFFGGLM